MTAVTESGAVGVRHVEPVTLRTRPAVTVVIPLYNYGQFIAQTLESVTSQEGVDVRVIVADDCSTDDGLAVAHSVAERDPRITVLPNERNLGVIATVRNTLRLVETEYVVKLDADDLLPPGSLARSLALLEAHPSVGLVYGRLTEFRTPEPPPPFTDIKDWTIWSGHRWLELGCRRVRNRIAQPEAVIRTSVLRAAGEHREDLHHTYDFEMWLRLASVADVGRVNGPTQGFYRLHGANQSRTVNGGFFTDVNERLRAYDALFAEARIADADRLHALARRALAREALRYATRLLAGAAGEAPVERDEAERLKQFAVSAWPGVRRWPQWPVLRYAERPRQKPIPDWDPVLLPHRALWKLGWATTAKHWYRTGLWGWY